jgi:hypothetical protein
MGKQSSFVLTTALSLALASARADGIHSFDKRDTARIQQVQIPALSAAGLTAFLERPVAFANATNQIGK